VEELVNEWVQEAHTLEVGSSADFPVFTIIFF
jgi:hypothetical protein